MKFRGEWVMTNIFDNDIQSLAITDTVKNLFYTPFSVVIEIDLGFVPENLKSIILYELDREYRHQNRLKPTKVDFDNNRNIIALYGGYNSDLQKTERMVKDILIKRRINEYVAVPHAERQDQIIILKREHSEQQGIYHCRHCAMAFDDEIQLSAHLRMHYFI
jgi:hypothetical protein